MQGILPLLRLAQVRTYYGVQATTAYRTLLFSGTIFPRRLRTFGEPPALFRMYKSEGPISKTNKPPRSNGLKQRRTPGVAPPTPKKPEEGSLPVVMVTTASSFEPACVGRATHVCPPIPQVICRAQADLFGGSGWTSTLLRSTTARSRGNSRKRHSGSNRQPCVCHASRHPTGRHPSLTNTLRVPHA